MFVYIEIQWMTVKPKLFGINNFCMLTWGRAELKFSAHIESDRSKPIRTCMSCEKEKKIIRTYVPSDKLSQKDRDERNRRNRANLREFYARKKALLNKPPNEITNSSGYVSVSNEEIRDRGSDNVRGRLEVRMDFGNLSESKRKAAIKRWRRDRSAAQSRVRILEQERRKLKTKLKSTQRSLQRLKKEKSKREEMTPSKQTEHDMNTAGLNIEQKQKLRRPLLFGHVISSEIKETQKTTPRHKMKAVHNIVAGRIAKKYKCIRYLAQKTGLGRRQLGTVDSKLHQLEPDKRQNKLERHKLKVIMFLKREDNSRMQPGKKDAKRIKKGEKVQIQILTDYLKNLYLKFKSENPEINISFTTFCRTRPSYIYKTAMTSRISCLCFKHQNAALTVKALRRYVDAPANPETVSRDKPTKDILQDKLPDEVKLSQWKRIETEEKGKKKSVTRILESTMPRSEFIGHFENQMNDFKEHVDRVHTQYEQLKTLKQNLPEHHMILQLDFAENYSCRSHEEVQSAYFNQSTVTLHPMVAYWKDENGNLTHTRFVTVSDEMSHKSSTVVAFLDDLIPELKIFDPLLDTIHYWSDSPSSQYRNKYIFDAVANHESTYGCRARWNYFESGHGKGPCDGLGGTSKRMADEATRSGRHVICDATDFYVWAISSSMKNVTFRFVSQDVCLAKAKSVSERQVKPVVGTMRLHANVGKGDSKILTRTTSCYCEECITGATFDSWNEARTYQPSGPVNESVCITEQPCIFSPAKLDAYPAESAKYDKGDFVAAVYHHAWYIGNIVDSDVTEVEINFMEKKKQFFQWPVNRDQMWVKKTDILCTIPSPVPTGKSNRMFKLIEDITPSITNSFERFLKH